jgi:hypothetical protein
MVRFQYLDILIPHHSFVYALYMWHADYSEDNLVHEQ